MKDAVRLMTLVLVLLVVGLPLFIHYLIYGDERFSGENIGVMK